MGSKDWRIRVFKPYLMQHLLISTRYFSRTASGVPWLMVAAFPDGAAG